VDRGHELDLATRDSNLLVKGESDRSLFAERLAQFDRGPV
jgi:hypothetical protein